MATWEQLNFQNSSSPVIEQLIFLHDFIIIILALILSIVVYTMILFKKNNIFNNTSNDEHELEVLWTFLPGAVLVLIAFPSLRLLYITEENNEQSITINTLGHQWYWSYEYSDFNNIEFDSFMLPLENSNQFRLLDVDNHTNIPENTPLQIFISSADVLHSWTIPSLGVNADSTPGRLNSISLFGINPGIFFGQCSEICGTNHSFIPIVLEISPLNQFNQWINTSNLLSNSLNQWIFNSF